MPSKCDEAISGTACGLYSSVNNEKFSTCSAAVVLNAMRCAEPARSGVPGALPSDRREGDPKSVRSATNGNSGGMSGGETLPEAHGRDGVGDNAA